MADPFNLEWRQQPVDEEWNVAPYHVIWISVAALDAAWRASADYIGAEGAGSLHGGRYAHFSKFFPNARFIYMPTILLDYAGAVSFTNGRHRFAWLRDRGLTALPIEVPAIQAGFFMSRFGTSDRFGFVSA